MKPHLSKLKSAEQQTASTQQNQISSSSREFNSVEEILRYHASQVTPPDTIAARLQQTIQQIPAPKLPWWRRWFKL